jgi:hypothetical protein
MYFVEKGEAKATGNKVARDGEWFTIRVKRLFDWSTLASCKMRHKTCEFFGGVELGKIFAIFYVNYVFSANLHFHEVKLSPKPAKIFDYFLWFLDRSPYLSMWS